MHRLHCLMIGLLFLGHLNIPAKGFRRQRRDQEIDTGEFDKTWPLGASYRPLGQALVPRTSHLEFFPGKEWGDYEPCPIPENVRRSGKSLQGHTPYGGSGAHPPVDVPPGLVLKGVYVVARHCTRLPTPRKIDDILSARSKIGEFLAVPVVHALENLAAARKAWNRQVSPLDQATDSVCSKCGYKEQILLGSRFGKFLRDALLAKRELSLRKTHPVEYYLAQVIFDTPEYTVVDRTKQSQVAFFEGVRSQLRPCLDHKKEQMCAAYVPHNKSQPPTCDGTPSDRHVLRYALGRPHFICRAHIDYQVTWKNIEEERLPVTNATKVALARMLNPSVYFNSTILEEAAFLAINMCEYYVARGSSDAIDWCSFLDEGYIRLSSEAAERKNAVKQGPISPLGYKHLGVLVHHFVGFGLRSLFGKKAADWDHQSVKPARNQLAIRVRIMHAHAETLLPLLTLLGIVRRDNFENHLQVQFSSNLRLEFYQDSLYTKRRSAHFVRILLNEQPLSLISNSTLIPWKEFKKHVRRKLEEVGYGLAAWTTNSNTVNTGNTLAYMLRKDFESVCRKGPQNLTSELMGRRRRKAQIKGWRRVEHVMHMIGRRRKTAEEGPGVVNCPWHYGWVPNDIGD